VSTRLSRCWFSRPRLACSGFTLAELLVTLAVIGILSAVVLNGIGMREWQRRRVNAVAMELTGWMEAVRRSALKGTGCRVTLHTSTSSTGGSVIASAEPVTSASSAVPNTCMNEQPLRLLTNTSGDVYSIQASPSTFTFTPRGTARGLANGNQNDLEITIALNGTPPVRCVQLTSPLGVIRTGFNETSLTEGCSYPGYF
jgi:prepilin-type N-terminal cleavage/methylation domain-containing protein